MGASSRSMPECRSPGSQSTSSQRVPDAHCSVDETTKGNPRTDHIRFIGDLACTTRSGVSNGEITLTASLLVHGNACRRLWRTGEITSRVLCASRPFYFVPFRHKDRQIPVNMSERRATTSNVPLIYIPSLDISRRRRYETTGTGVAQPI
jgi:hypothetical protein